MTTLQTMPPDTGDPHHHHRPSRRITLQTLVGSLVVVCLVVGILAAESHSHKTSPSTTPPAPVPTQAGPVTPLRTAGYGFGFYSAGLHPVACYGSCRPGTKDYIAQQADRQRMTELQAMHVTFVTNNESIVRVFRQNPAGVLRYLDELHAHHIRVSYSVASGINLWFTKGQFSPSRAATMFARTDLNHDGVSDLDGHLDALYQGHEVLEWATHAQRVRIYQTAKHWFPHTPVMAYYAAITKPVDPALANQPHPGGPGGLWKEYAYGPGETDVALVNVRRSSTPATINGNEEGGKFSAPDFAAAARETVAVVRKQTPNTPIFISTNLAGDDAMATNPHSMWTTEELQSWYAALVAIPGVDGVLLRSYGRFTFDLANPMFGAQRNVWGQLGALAARITNGSSPGGSAP
jgi:hypothetical protein